MFHIDANGFSGVIPEELFSLKKLRRLWIEKNRLLGNVAGFAQLTQLRTLVMGGNWFGEEIPDALGSLQFLRVLRLDNCRFVGSVPMQMLRELRNLREFSCANCRYMDPRSVTAALRWATDNGIQVTRG